MQSESFPQRQVSGFIAGLEERCSVGVSPAALVRRGWLSAWSVLSQYAEAQGTGSCWCSVGSAEQSGIKTGEALNPLFKRSRSAHGVFSQLLTFVWSVCRIISTVRNELDFWWFWLRAYVLILEIPRSFS